MEKEDVYLLKQMIMALEEAEFKLTRIYTSGDYLACERIIFFMEDLQSKIIALVKNETQ